jgi:hypothetical protein
MNKPLELHPIGPHINGHEKPWEFITSVNYFPYMSGFALNMEFNY